MQYGTTQPKEGRMNRRIASFVVVALVAGATTALSAGNKEVNLSDEKLGEAVTNLLIGLRTDNLGLRESCAYFLGEYKATEAVIPLMAMLHTDPSESARLVAALALCRIGEPRGTYAVKEAATFDDNETLRQRCAWFYDQYVQPGSFRFVVEPTGAPEYANRP